MYIDRHNHNELIPASLIHQLATELEHGAETALRWGASDAGKILALVSEHLRGVLNNPIHRWVSPAEAARSLGKSEETIRRWCRQGTAPFRFRRDEGSGRYEVWLADLATSEVINAA